MGDGLRIGVQIEHTPNACHHSEHVCRGNVQQLQLQGVLPRGPRANPQPAGRLRRAKHPLITERVNLFDTGQGALL